MSLEFFFLGALATGLLSTWTTWTNTMIIIFLFNLYIGLPNIGYLCYVYHTFFWAWYAGPLKPEQSSIIKSKAFLNYIDRNKHMNNSKYFHEFERGRRDWLYRIGSEKFSNKFKCNLVMTGITTRFRRELKPLQSFTVETKLIYFDRTHIYLEQRIVDHGFVYAVAYVNLTIVSKELKSRVSTENFVKFIGLKDKSELKDSLKNWMEYLQQSSMELRLESGLSPRK